MMLMLMITAHTLARRPAVRALDASGVFCSSRLVSYCVSSQGAQRMAAGLQRTVYAVADALGREGVIVNQG